MTMIVGIITQTGIVLASDTRCMVGHPGKYVGHHGYAEKIVVSSIDNPSQIACAIACSSLESFGESPLEYAKYMVSNNKYPRNASLHLIHCEFEERFKNINKTLPAGFSITSIFAKFENNCPCLSYGNLKCGIIIKTHSGMFCYPPNDEASFDNKIMPNDQAIVFAEEIIRNKSTIHGGIGGDVDVVFITFKNSEWIKGKDRRRLPVKAKELKAMYEQDKSLITPIDDRNMVDGFFKSTL